MKYLTLNTGFPEVYAVLRQPGDDNYWTNRCISPLFDYSISLVFRPKMALYKNALLNVDLGYIYLC